MFDCATPYGMPSVNDIVPQGPYLPDNFVVVLRHFCKEALALITNVKAWHHQSYVTSEDRGGIGFLSPEDDVTLIAT